MKSFTFCSMCVGSGKLGEDRCDTCGGLGIVGRSMWSRLVGAEHCHESWTYPSAAISVVPTYRRHMKDAGHRRLLA